jgi:hypothetical protein
MDTTRYWIWDTQTQAVAELAIVDTALGFPDGQTTRYTQPYQAGTKWVAACDATLDSSILFGKSRLTMAEAIAAGATFTPAGG